MRNELDMILNLMIYFTSKSGFTHTQTCTQNQHVDHSRSMKESDENLKVIRDQKNYEDMSADTSADASADVVGNISLI